MAELASDIIKEENTRPKKNNEVKKTESKI